MKTKEHAINKFFITGVKNTTFLYREKKCFKSFFLLELYFQNLLTMKKEEYYSPLVSTHELEWEDILCASADDNSGLPGNDFDDSTIYDGDEF